jgi:flagellin-like hook-associated protein FlgL
LPSPAENVRHSFQEDINMSGIVLSSSVRQNLLSLQSTADLLATTQSRLSTGKKVNTALDNPTNFFTAQSLDGRASDISNLLDGIGNGVQVLQAANAGITSLSKLVDTAKSIASQALQTTVGYSTKSNVSATIAGATATDLRGTTSFTNATAAGNVLYSGNAGGVTAATAGLSLGGLKGTLTGTVINAATTGASLLNGTVTPGDANALVAAGDSFTVNGKTITFAAGDRPASAPAGLTEIAATNLYSDVNGNSTVYLGSVQKATVADVLAAIDLAGGAQSNVAGTLTPNAGQIASSVSGGGALVLKSSTGADLSIIGKADTLKALGLTTSLGAGNVTVGVARTTSAASLGNLITDGSTLQVNGNTITFKNAPTPAASATHTGINGNIETDGAGNSTVYLQSATIADTLNAIDLATGVQVATLLPSGATLATSVGNTASSIVSGTLKISTGTVNDLAITATGNALSALGLNGVTGNGTQFNATRTAGAGGINGKTLNFTSFNGGTAVGVTFGDGTGGTVKTLDQLNAQLLANNQTATLDSLGKLTISATNDYASSTLGTVAAGGVISGTVTAALSFSTSSAPVIDSSAQAVRSNLVRQYNDILAQITTTAQDASFNGINLLAGDQLKLTFNETGKSTLSITGVTFNAAGLGLANLVNGTDFIDNAATNKVVANLTNASTALRTQGSALGSNLSIVQIRQDFSKNLINVLQTGSSNLTLADTNEEAANSQALSTRQSIAVSALALANTSQQSVLQLLR